MNINKTLIKEILLIVFLCTVLILALISFGSILEWLGWIIGILTPFIVGMIVAYFVNIWMRWFENKPFKWMSRSKHKFVRGLRRPLCMIISYLLVFGIIIALLISILPSLAQTVMTLATNLPSYAKTFGEWIKNIGSAMGFNTESLFTDGDLWTSIMDEVTNALSNLSSSTISSITETGSTFVSSIASVAMGLIISVYLLVQKEHLIGLCKKIAIAGLPKKIYLKLIRFLRLCNHAFSGFLTGQCLEAIIVGCVAITFLLITDMPYASLIASMLAVCNIIPMFGPLIGAAIGTLLILLISPVKALIFLAFIVVWQLIEAYMIYPRVVGKKINTPPLLVIAAVIIGGSVGGMGGILVAIPFSSVLLKLVSEGVAKRLARKRIPLKTVEDVEDSENQKEKKKKKSKKSPEEDNSSSEENHKE